MWGLVGGLVGGLGRVAIGGLGAIAKPGLGGFVGKEAAKVLLLYPIIGAAGRALGLQVGYGGSQPPAPAPAPIVGGGKYGLPLTPQQFEYLYGRNNYQIGPFELPFGRQEGFLERQSREQRALQREISLGQQAVQRYGYDVNRAIAQRGYETQQAIAQLTGDLQRDLTRTVSDTQRAIAYGQLANQFAINDFATRRQLAGLYGGYQRDVALADRNLAGMYDANRTQSRIASIQGNVARYQADRGVEASRINTIAPRLAAIGNVFTRRY